MPRNPIYHSAEFLKNDAAARQRRYRQRKAASDPDFYRNHSAAAYDKYPHLFNEASVRRRLQLERATPPWTDQEEIRRIYSECPKGCHVDHVIPLRGKTVSGLHVPANLQYLPAVENMKKSNKFGMSQ